MEDVYVYPKFRCGDIKMLELIPKEMMVGDKPRVRALRQLIIQLVGNIVEENTTTEHLSSTDYGLIASVAHKLRVHCHNPYFVRMQEVPGFDYFLEASAVADAGAHNSDGDFAKYPVAMGDIRAKGRAYVGMLGLNIVTAEEIGEGNNFKKHTTSGASQNARSTVKKSLELLTTKIGKTLDPQKVAQYLGFNYDNVNEDDISKMNAKIRKWTNGENIPAEVIS